MLFFKKLKIDLDNLSNLLENNKVLAVRDMLCKLIPSYQSNSKIVDHIYDEQLNFRNGHQSSTMTKNQESKVISFKGK